MHMELYDLIASPKGIISNTVDVGSVKRCCSCEICVCLHAQGTIGTCCKSQLDRLQNVLVGDGAQHCKDVVLSILTFIQTTETMFQQQKLVGFNRCPSSPCQELRFESRTLACCCHWCFVINSMLDIFISY